MVDNTDTAMLKGFIRESMRHDVQVFTDDARAYAELGNHEWSVKHSRGEVRAR